MSNLSEEESSMLEEAQYKELMEYWDFEESWNNNPLKIKLEKQIEEIHREIDELIKWPDFNYE